MKEIWESSWIKVLCSSSTGSPARTCEKWCWTSQCHILTCCLCSFTWTLPRTIQCPNVKRFSQWSLSVAIPSSSGGSFLSNESDAAAIISAYSSILSAKKILAVYRASGSDSQATAECLATGTTLALLLKMLRKQFDEQPTVKPTIDPDDAWADTVTFYKSKQFDPGKNSWKPALDTGVFELSCASLFSSILLRIGD